MKKQTNKGGARKGRCQSAYSCVRCGDRLQAFDLFLSCCDGCLVFEEL